MTSIADRELQALVLRRDNLKTAVAMYEALLASNGVQTAISETTAAYASSISSNKQEVARLKAAREKLEDELTRTTTSVAYSTKEAERLERVLKDMKERLDRPRFIRKRAVRTPLERRLEGLHSVDLWLRHGRLHLIDWDATLPRQVRFEKHGSPPNMSCDVSLVPLSGWEVDEAFFKSSDWREIKERLDAKGFARRFCDEESFPELCELRDAFIHFRKMYNWHIYNEDVLRFVSGYDGHVQ